jgi:hypothetical protein
MGGRKPYAQVVRALLGESRLVGIEHNKLAAALNEFFVGAGGGHLVGYIDLPTGDGRDGPGPGGPRAGGRADARGE